MSGSQGLGLRLPLVSLLNPERGRLTAAPALLKPQTLQQLRRPLVHLCLRALQKAAEGFAARAADAQVSQTPVIFSKLSQVNDPLELHHVTSCDQRMMSRMSFLTPSRRADPRQSMKFF